jgi:hypothetical protein
MTTESAWSAALARFEAGYGDGPPDLDDPTDRAAFLALLTEEVRDGITRAIVAVFKDETERLRAKMAEGSE